MTTKIKLKLPFALYMLTDNEYPLVYKNTEVIIKTKFIQKKDYYEEAKNILFFYDTYGLYGHTEIELIIKNKISDLIKFEQDVIEIVNRLIDTYREETKHYWASNIRKHDLQEIDIKQFNDEGNISTVIATDFGSVGVEIPNKIISNNIKEKLFKKDRQFNLYKVYLLNSLDHLLQEKYESAIVEANIGLDNFLYNVIYNYLKEVVDSEEIEKWLNHGERCNYCDLIKYRNDKDIIAYMNEKKELPHPIEKVKKLINFIRKFNGFPIRNFIVHGKLDQIPEWDKKRKNAGLQIVFYFYDFINIFEEYKIDLMLLPRDLLEYMQYLSQSFKNKTDEN